MRDDGFGGHVAKALDERELPAGVSVLDFGTGGLDLAYEVMRGYDALVLVDVSRQGGEPGTLYVHRARPGGDHADRGRRGRQPARDGPEDRAAVRQDGRRLARQGRGRRLRAAEVEEMGLELSPEVAGGGRARGRAGARDGRRAALRRRLRRAEHARALDLERDRRHRPAPRRRPAGDPGRRPRRRPAPGRPRVARVLLRDRRPRHRLRGRGARARAGRRAGCAASCGHEWDPAPEPVAATRPAAWVLPQFRCPACEARRGEVVRGDELEVESIEVEAIEEEQCIAPRSRSPRTRSTPTRRSRTPTATTSTARGWRSST